MLFLHTFSYYSGNLTWRDMQHLVAISSNWDNVKVNDIQRNGGNFRGTYSLRLVIQSWFSANLLWVKV